MERIIGCCGLVCNECDAFKATQDDNDAERKRVAKEWTVRYSHPFKAKDINCDGCTVLEGRHIPYCEECEIRTCALGRRLANCGHCDEYMCDKLSSFIEYAPQAEKVLEEIRKTI